METRREKLIYYVAVPIVSAVVGAIATVIIGSAFGVGSLDESVKAVVSDHTLTGQQRQEMVKLLLSQDDDLWSALRFLLGMSVAPIAVLVGAYAAKIRNS